MANSLSMHESLRPFTNLIAVFSRFYILCKGVTKSRLSSRISLVFLPVLFYAFQASAQTWLPAGGGDWTVGANWSGGSAPIPGASVVINSDQSGNITNIPTINLSNLTITGSCVFAAASSGNTVIVTGNFTVAAGETFTIGAAGARMNFTLTATAIGTISGTAILDSFVGGTDRFFINNGDLSIPVGGLLSGVGESIFSTTSGSTLRIGSPAGITLSGATGSVQTTGAPSSRIYDTGANYVYIGNSNQGVGNGLPATVASLTVANTGGGGNNTVTLASNISITNSLSVNSGVFALGTNNVTSVGSVSMTGTSIAGTGTLTLAGNVSTNSSTTTATISAPIALNAIRTLTIANGAANPDLTISSIISTTGGLVKNGAGLLFLSASNSFTGGVSIDAGTLRLGNAGALNSGTPNAVAFGAGSTGILQLNGNSVTVSDINTNIAVGTPVIENGVAGTSTLTINTSGSSTYAGTIQNGGAGITAISKSGTGSLTLSGGNTHTGTTTLSAGTLSINSATAIGTGSLTISGGTIDNTSGGGITLSTNNAQNWNGDFTFTGTQNLNMGTGVVAMSANRLITTNASNLTVGGIISGGFRLTKDGGGTLTLTGANTFSGGTTLNAGTLNINNPNALGTVAGTFIINGGTIDNATGGSITTLNYPQTWAGDFSFTGTQNLNLGTGNVTIGSNRQVTVNANTLTVGGVISAPGVNLTKAGAGTLSFGSNAVTVNSLANNAGILNSTSGTLTIAGNFNSTGTFNHSNGLVIFNGGSPQSLAGVIYNHLNLTGAGQKNASGNVSVVGNLTNASVFDLSTHTLSVSGTIANTGGTIRFAGPSNGMAINTGTVEYYGAGQNVAAGIYQNLTISQSSGEASLGGAVTVNGVLTLNTGRLNLNGFNLTLGPTATISVASPSASKMIVATGGSEVIKTFNSTGLFDFPIGDNSGTAEYSPVSVNITSGTGFPANVSVSVTDGKHPNNASSANFISRYWNVTQTGITNCIATISGVYLDADINGAEASIKGAELTGAFNQVSNPWIKYAAVTAASNTLTCTGVIPNLSSGLTSSFTGITSADPMVSITGGGITICAGNSVALNAPVVGGDPTILYSWTPAAGLSATSIANPTASPTVTTVYTVNIYDGNGITATSNTTITVDQTAPSAIAGADQNLCNTSSFTLAGNAAAPGTGAWTIQSGTGTVTTPSSPTSTITGVTATTVVRWTISNGVCGSTFDEVSLTNEPVPVVDAGSNAETCQGINYNFSTQSTPASASNYGTISWAHTGTGVLFNANTFTPTYQPGVGETGVINFTLTATSVGGTCSSVNDVMTLTITPAVALNAGTDVETCEGVAEDLSLRGGGVATAVNYSTLSWTGGTGSFSDATILNPVYTPGVGETGAVTLTITANGNGSCATVTDQIVINVTPAVIVNAGSDDETCEGVSFDFGTRTTVATASNYSSVSWSGGAGTIFNGLTLNPTYFPGPGETGIVTFTLTAFGNGSCVAQVSTMDLLITPAPIANAGNDDAVCEGTATFNFNARAVVASSLNGTVSWTHNGMGSLNDNTLLNPVYTVGAGDVGNTVTFTLMVTSPSAVCSVVLDQFTLDVNQAPIVIIPSPSITVCEPAQIQLSGFVSGAATDASWSIVSAGGSLSVSSKILSEIRATYDTVTSDVNSTLIFRLTSNDPDGVGPCIPAAADLSVIVNESAKVFAGADFEVCEYDDIDLNGSFSGSTSSVIWSGGSGAPQFGNVTSPITSYDMTPAERAATGLVLTFTLTTDDPVGVCPSTFDQVKVTVNDTTFASFSGLELIYQEDDPIDALVGFPPGGTFTGPGIISGTSDFNPDFANIGTNVIVYSYQDPSTGCFSNPQQTTIVNPITTILWSAKLYNSSTSLYDITAPDNAGVQEICATIRPGDVQLKGTPDVLDPMASVVTPPYFTISPDVSPSYIFQKLDGQYYINTKAMPPATYIVTYVYTNNFEAQTQLSKPINVLSAPMARIDVGNSCVSSLINFTESSFIPVNNGANLQKWTWAFGNGIGSSDPEPQYQYPVAGTYNVTLEVETDEGCKHDTLRVVRVGPVPKMNFTWSEFCNGNDTKFVDGTFVGGSTIIQYTWEFADGFSVTGPAGAPIPGGTNGGRTGGTYTNPNHRYDTFGQYNVKLTVSTDDGCVNDTTRRAFILSYGTPSPTAGYIEDFESGPGTWVGTRTDISIPTDTSWVFGSPSGAVINSASSGINAWWTGGNPNTAGLKSTYYPAEKSAVIGPCVNLTNIKRPMLSLDYWSDAEDGRDGAVVQFSVDGGISWQAIGNDAGAGLNWYDGRALPGNPGLQPIGQFGWSKSDYQTGGWKTARYNLDQIPKADRNEVIFRVAYGSNNDNQFNDPNRTVEYNGFAFDNIFIGEKQRNVLVEYFTNAGVNPTANDYLNNLYLDQRNVLNKDSSDFFKIQYHIANPSADVINQDNPVDPAARSLYYGVSQPPVGIMDGILGNYYGTNFNGDQTKINAVEVDRRALEDPLFDILVTENTTTADSINLNVEFEYRAAQVHTTPVTFYVGLVDSLVSGNVHVLRKMLLGSEGMTVSTTWNTGDSTIIPVKSIIDVPIGTANSNLWIVAFVQDRNTKRIHQTAFVKAGAPKDEAVVVGLDDPVLNGAKSIQIYPNPASHQLNFASEYRLMEGYTYSIVDQRGVTVLEGELKEDIFNPQQVELDKVTNGIYFVIISRGGRALVHRKIAVLNRN